MQTVQHASINHNHFNIANFIIHALPFGHLVVALEGLHVCPFKYWSIANDAWAQHMCVMGTMLLMAQPASTSMQSSAARDAAPQADIWRVAAKSRRAKEQVGHHHTLDSLIPCDWHSGGQKLPHLTGVLHVKRVIEVQGFQLAECCRCCQVNLVVVLALAATYRPTAPKYAASRIK